MSLKSCQENKNNLKLESGMLARYKWSNSPWRYLLVVRKLPNQKVLVFYSGKLKKVYIDGINKMKQLESWEEIQCL